jgi:hypothetical protein
VEPVRLLWTGGWDSTFRLCELVLVERRPVQPLYMYVPERPAREVELEVQARIWRQLRDRASDPGLLRYPTIHLQRWAPGHPEPSAELRERFARVQSRHPELSGQFLRLAHLGDLLDWWGVEVSLARGEGHPGFNEAAFVDHLAPPGALEFADTDEGWLLRRFAFGTLHRTRADMRELAEANGFADLLAQSWYCQEPVGRRVCGRCRPCVIHREQTGEDVPVAPILARGRVRAANLLARVATGVPR